MKNFIFDKNIDFIGFAVTPLQINNIIYFIKALKLNGSVIVASHNKTGYPNNINKLKEEGIEVLKINESYGEFENKGIHIPQPNKGNDLLFLTAFFRDDWYQVLCNIFPNRRIVYMIIDSGLGSYNDDIENEIQERSKLYKNVIDARKYKNDNHGLCLNEKFSAVYLNRLFLTKINNKESIDDYLKDSILICSQPLIEDGIIKDDKDLKFYENIIELAEKSGLKACLKAHPRESKDKYNKLKAKIIESDNTVEEILANCSKPKCIISPFSTVATDAKLLYDVPAYNIYKILGIKGYDYLEQHYSGIFKFPDDINEITELKA